MSFDLKLQEGDLKIGQNGDLQSVIDSEKLTQDVLKIILTNIGANPFHPWYGSPIGSSLIGTAYDQQFISAVATSQLQSTLEKLMDLQREQQKIFQMVTPQEHIAAVHGVRVNRNTADPRFFEVTVSVLSKAFQRVPITLTIEP